MQLLTSEKDLLIDHVQSIFETDLNYFKGTLCLTLFCLTQVQVLAS